MKKVKIVLIVSVLIFLTLLTILLVQKFGNKEKTVSLREQYQNEMKQPEE